MTTQQRAVAEPLDGTQLPIFSSILCSVDGAPGDEHAVHQAASLAGRDGRLELVAVTRDWGYGADHSLNTARAREALRDAGEVARRLGLEPEVRVVEAGSRTDALLEQADSHDLLVIADDGAKRAQGILLGATSITLVHHARCAVLVARRPPVGTEFGRLALLADDGSDSSRGAVRIAIDLAASHDSTIEVISPAGLDHSRAATLAEDSAAIYQAAGAEPVRVLEKGAAATAILTMAERLGVSLVLIGSRGLRGLRALTSVSERVATRAPCSVLVARPRA